MFVITTDTNQRTNHTRRTKLPIRHCSRGGPRGFRYMHLYQQN